MPLICARFHPRGDASTQPASVTGNWLLGYPNTREEPRCVKWESSIEDFPGDGTNATADHTGVFLVMGPNL